MNQVWRIFCKDGLEVLRDRRTLFVNIILPMLLYPVIMLFMIQVLQLTKASPAAPPRVATVDAPGALMRLLREVPETSKPTGKPVTNLLAPPPPVKLDLVELPAAAAKELQDLAALPELRTSDHPPLALKILREHQLVAALVHRTLPDGRNDVVVLQDDASARLEDAQTRIGTALEAWRKELIAQRLAAAGLSPLTVTPLVSRQLTVAPPAESLRTKVAGLIPLLLVLLVASSVFYPALDLIAGERERGTLETLLSLPVRRRDIFLGKLLVVCVAALGAVLLNLLSLSVSVALLGAQMPASATSSVDLASLFSVGSGTLLLCVVILLPLTVTLAAAALAITGLAHSAKEAQNYLTPMLLVVLIAPLVAIIPGTKPNLALDLIPITGAVLALKEALQSPTLPWLHLGLAFAVSLTVAAVVVAWSARLLDSEAFRYPGLVRAGWGRFRRWGAVPTHPGGLEALGVYAVAVAGMTLGSGFFAHTTPAFMIGGPLLAFVALPALIHAWAAGLPASALGLRLPDRQGWIATALVLPFAICVSAVVGGIQQQLVPKELLEEGSQQVYDAIFSIRDQGGPLLLIAVVAILPGMCEELLCRGTLFAGLRSGIGLVGGAAVSAFLFAVLHLSPWRFAPQFMLGILLAIVVWRTRSVLPAMVIHAGHNAVLVLAELYGSKESPANSWLGTIAGLALLGAISAWLITAPTRANKA